MSKEHHEAKLGTIPTGDEGRDAVHTAIVPVRAAERLMRGTPVKLTPDGKALPCLAREAIGVVDPFRADGERAVPEGDWFWLCMYPKTITGLRHVWDHPYFDARDVLGNPAEESERWLRQYVKENCPYDADAPDGGYGEFLRHVRQDREIYFHGTDLHDLSDLEDPEDLFRHLSVVLGRRIDASYFDSFSCSC